MRTLFPILLVLAAAAVAAAATHTVDIVGLTFSPAEITINAGDTVEWVKDFNTVAHTVTDGAGPTDAGAGSLFDATLDSPSQTFDHTFTNVGDVPYFCRFHFGLGMTGIVHVGPEVPVEPTTWSEVKALYR